MNLALMQAKNALGNTGRNPAVGCVIEKKNCVLSAGKTGANGRPHAEFNAITYSKNKIKNANLFVTLEPCSNYGKTKPCVNIIIKSKIKKVFFGIYDPDKRSYNKSSLKLKKNKIFSQSGVLSQKINYFYKNYINYKKGNLPFLTCKLAASNDFYTKNKKKKWITNKFSRGRVHMMRSNHDCILTSAKTIHDDNPRLTCRINGLEKRSPVIIILDKLLKTPINSKIVKNSKKHKTIIFFNKLNKKKIRLLKKSKIKLLKEKLNNDNNFNLRKILLKINAMGFSRVFLESGPLLAENFLRENLVDEVKLFLSSSKLKKNGENNIRSFIMTYLKTKKHIIENVNLFGDKLISYQLK